MTIRASYSEENYNAFQNNTQAILDIISMIKKILLNSLKGVQLLRV